MCIVGVDVSRANAQFGSAANGPIARHRASLDNGRVQIEHGILTLDNIVIAHNIGTHAIVSDFDGFAAVLIAEVVRPNEQTRLAIAVIVLKAQSVFDQMIAHSVIGPKPFHALLLGVVQEILDVISCARATAAVRCPSGTASMGTSP